MKHNFKTIRIDEDELKIIQDELERGCFETQQELFNEIYERVIQPQIQNHQNFEKELCEKLNVNPEARKSFYKALEKKDFVTASKLWTDAFFSVWVRIEEILGDE